MAYIRKKETVTKLPYKGGATASKIGTYKGGATVTKTNRKTGESSTTSKSLTKVSADEFKSDSGKMKREAKPLTRASTASGKPMGAKANRAKINERKYTY